MTAPSPASEPADSISPRTAWTAVAVLLVLYALAMLDRQIIALLVQPIRADFGVSDFQISLLQGFAFSILFCLLGVPLGFAVDRFPRRIVILVGVLIWALAATASGLAASFSHLFLARLFVGVGEAALAPAAYSMLSDLFPRKKLTFALSVYSIGALAGSALAYGLGGSLIAIADAGHMSSIFAGMKTWQIAFVVTGLPGLALAFLIFLIPEPKRKAYAAASGDMGQLFAFLKQRRTFLLLHFGGFGCIGIMTYGKGAWLPTVLIRTYDLPVSQVGAMMAAYTLVVGIVTMMSTGRIVDWMVGRGHQDAHLRFYVYASIILTVTGGLAFLAPTAVSYFAIIAFSSIGTAFGAIAAGALQVVTPSALRGRVSALFLLVTGLTGMICGPALVAAVTDFVFHDDSKVNVALSSIHFVFGPLACLMFFLGLKPMREAYAQLLIDENNT